MQYETEYETEDLSIESPTLEGFGIKYSLPKKLPFNISTYDLGQPLNQREIDNFSTRIADFLKDIDYFNWVLRNSHGVHESTGMPDYMVWSTDSEAWGDDIQAVKEGSLVTFKHVKGHGWHNIMISTSQLLSQAATGYLLTNDERMGRIVEQYCKGITATMKGMVFGEDDELEYIMARNILPESHNFLMKNGREKAVDYSEWHNEEVHWNAQRFKISNNPYWGEVYVTNTRSKDDLPHIFRAAAFLPYIISISDDEKIIKAAAETCTYLQGFCTDIVENNFHIRTKNSKGEALIPKGDLASFVNYNWIAPLAENNARLSTVLISNNGKNNIKFSDGIGGFYEYFARKINYYNYKIIRGFHMSAIIHSLINGRKNTAYNMLKGLINRADNLMKGKGHKKGMNNPRWKADLATFLLRAAAVGMPLTSKQARLVHSEYEKSISEYEKFNRWDLWDESVPDGVYGSNGGYKPRSNNLIKIENLALILELHGSPFTNPLGAEVVNPEIIKEVLS
ncbi:MAG: hypothetical protein JW791_04665 [Nanoarchaeota archaeon]|nr:hypothetical protein [Nanoarchaeota archaeon]